MAIFKGGSILVPNGSSDDNTTYDSLVEATKVKNYWGKTPKQVFKILSKNLEELFKKAKHEHKEVALRVKNIEDPKKVSAQWIVFDAHKVKKSENYYVMDEKFYDDGKVPLQVRFDGELGTVNSLKSFEYDYVCAIIGSTVIDAITHYSVFFHPGHYIFEYIRQPMTGPGGGGGGLEIPVT